jgi:hypothetical protein
VFAAAGRRTARVAFDAWRRSLRDLGLEVNEGKTRWAFGRVDALDVLGGATTSHPT